MVALFELPWIRKVAPEVARQLTLVKNLGARPKKARNVDVHPASPDS